MKIPASTTQTQSPTVYYIIIVFLLVLQHMSRTKPPQILRNDFCNINVLIIRKLYRNTNFWWVEILAIILQSAKFAKFIYQQLIPALRQTTNKK